MAGAGFLAAFLLASPGSRAAEDPATRVPEVIGQVRFHQKISQTSGGFMGTLDDGDLFGSAVASVGDLDGDGNTDLAVGAADDDGGLNKGAVWILFLHANGTVKSHQKISQTSGGFTGTLEPGNIFGNAAASLGDLDGDGNFDIAVGAGGDDDGGPSRGAVWILFLHSNGTVKSHQKISDTDGGFTGSLDDFDVFGSSLASLGDLDGDGIIDLAVGTTQDDDGGLNRGAVWILFLNPDGTVKSHQKISQTSGGFTGTLDDSDRFGQSLASLGDLDRDGTTDLAVGALFDDDGGPERGAVWILFLNPDGTVRSHQKISQTSGGFTGTLDDSDFFASSLAALRDLDCDGTTDLAVGAKRDAGDGFRRGAVWVLFLAPNGMVRLHTKISDNSGGFNGTLVDEDRFGSAVGSLGDLDGDGNVDLAVGAPEDDDGGLNHGAVWNLFLDGEGCYNFDPLLVFTDGFESGDTSAWFSTLP